MIGTPKDEKLKAWQLELTPPIGEAINSSCIGLAEGFAPEKIFDLAIQSGIQHICQRDGFVFLREIQSATCMIESSDQFLNFPVSTILAPVASGVRSERSHLLFEEKFDHSEQKAKVLESAIKALKAKMYRDTLISEVVSIVDEMFTNAVYNAPFVDLKTGENPGVNRNMEVKFEGGRTARVFLGSDESRLLVGCADPFGSLDVSKFMQKILNTYQKGAAAQIDLNSTAGAGLGTFMIFNNVASMYVGVWPGKTTVMCCAIPSELNNRRRAQLGKHFHWIKPA